jgi:transcriptional regulator with XRE-family HTH domain
MQIRTPRDLGACVRGLRRQAGLSQAELASRAGVGRQWLVELEAGKRTAEVGLVLATLQAVGATLDISDGMRLSTEPATKPSRYDGLDIPGPDEVLDRAIGPGRRRP